MSLVGVLSGKVGIREYEIGLPSFDQKNRSVFEQSIIFTS